MEDFNSLDSEFRKSSIVSAFSDDDRENLELAAYWAKFMGIMGYIFAGLVGMGAFFAMFGVGAILSFGGANPMGSSMPTGILVFIVILYLALALLGFHIAKSLYNFGKKTQIALANNSDENLSEALVGLKSFFRTNGIISAIVAILYGLIVIIAIGSLLFAKSL